MPSRQTEVQSLLKIQRCLRKGPGREVEAGGPPAMTKKSRAGVHRPGRHLAFFDLTLLTT